MNETGTMTMASEDRVLTAYGVARRLAYDRAKARTARRYLRARGRELDPARALEIDIAGSGAKADADFWAQVWSAWARAEISENVSEQAAQRALTDWRENWRALGAELGLGITDADTGARGYVRADAAGWAVEAADRVRDAVRYSKNGWHRGRGVSVDFARRALERARAARKEG